MRKDHKKPADYHRAFKIGMVLNVGFVIIEIIFSITSDSLASRRYLPMTASQHQ